MMHGAHIAIRRPRAALLIWLVLVVGLAFGGRQLEHRFSPSVITAKGTESARAAKLAKGSFGDSVLTPIMLVGPAKQLDRQGPALVRALRKRRDTRVLAPWDRSPGSDSLRPQPTAATIVASIQRSEKKVMSTSLPQIEKTVRATISAPVVAHVTGQATIDRAMKDQALSTTRTAIFVALPLVFLLLLFVVRSILAAAAITLLGATVLPIGYGLLALVATLIPVDAVAAAGAAIVGLALSVGFGLLILQRHREELARGQTPTEAAARSAATAGRTVALAGTAVVLAMIIATSLSPTEILNSVGIGATIMAAVATLGAVIVLPAALRQLGARVHPAPAPSAVRRWHRPLGRVEKVVVPLAAAAGAFALLAALSAPVLDMRSGSPDPKLLPADNAARKDYEAVANVMGVGWVAPFEIIVTNRSGAITTRAFLKRLDTFQRQIGRDRAVASVVGPGTLVSNAQDLQGVPKGLKQSAAVAEKSKKDLKKLIAGLRLATGGVSQLKSGLGSAANGASQLHGGSGQASSGASQLSSGLSQADAGAKQLKSGSAQAADGARQLAGGLSQAEDGVTHGLPAVDNLGKQLQTATSQVAGLAGAAQSAQSDVAKATNELGSSAAKGDPHVAAALSALQAAGTAAGQLAAEASAAQQTASTNATSLALVRQQMGDLQSGLRKLRNGADDLSAGLKQLSGGNSDLASGLSQLDAGAGQLADGLAQLDTGAGQLASGLAAGAGPSLELLTGMNTITGSVIKSRKGIPSTKDLQKLQAQAPHLFDSGYYVLAALDGAPIASYDAASFVVSVGRGGLAGRITVVPKAGVDSASTRALRDRLSAATARFARATGTGAAVGGTGAALVDYRRVATDDLPAVIAALLVFTFLFLALVSRSLILPAIAVVLNLLTVGAAFGVLALLFSGNDPVLGGPGFIDPVTVIAVLTLILGLSIDYELFVLTRVRESADAGLDQPMATRLGLRRTSSVGAGAGLAMLAVVVAFVPSPITIVRELAIGMLVAIAIDAAVVRPILLPALMRALGPAAWWFPGWLDRRLPRLHFKSFDSPEPAVRSKA